jgi:hypothetical protein
MSTKFYNISADRSIIDVYSVKISHNRKAINTAKWYEWLEKNLLSNFYSFSPTELSIPKLKHDPNTPLTDIIDIERILNMRGCVVSSKFLNILNDFKLPEIKIYPIEILHKEVLHMYYYILFLHDSTIDIDYNKTTFHLRKDGITIPEAYISYDKWANTFKTEKSFSPREKNSTSLIYFKNHGYDFFTIDRIFGRSVIITERLKKELEKELFGIVFDECKNYHN